MRGCVLVTGASGFIGPSLCRRLGSDGWRVRAVMRRPAEGPWDEAVTLDLGRQPIPLGLLAEVDCVFHLAGKAHALAEGPGAEEEYRLSNVQSTLDLLAAARAAGVRAFVYFSSVKAMGQGMPARRPECRCYCLPTGAPSGSRNRRCSPVVGSRTRWCCGRLSSTGRTPRDIWSL